MPEDHTCHTLGATTITDLLDSVVNSDDVQNLAGHADHAAHQVVRATSDQAQHLLDLVTILIRSIYFAT